MTRTALIKNAFLSTYAARTSGDLDGTMAHFADATVYQTNGKGTGLPGFVEPIRGKENLRPIMAELIKAFSFSNWKAVTLVVDGDTAVLHWNATVTLANGRSGEFDVVDVATFDQEGKIATFYQSTDTATIMTMIAV